MDHDWLVLVLDLLSKIMFMCSLARYTDSIRLLFASLIHPKRLAISQLHGHPMDNDTCMNMDLCLTYYFLYKVSDGSIVLTLIYILPQNNLFIAYLEGSAPFPRRYRTHLSPLFWVDLLIAK